MLSEFKKILIDQSATVKDALKQLDLNTKKILFVVDKDLRLIGSLTDGDIRRWILKEGSLEEKVDQVCFKGTYFVYESEYKLDDLKKEIFKRKIKYVPVVDNNKTVLEFLVWDSLFNGELIRKPKEKLNALVVIMAGGKGTRLDPFTRILPKPLIPIGEKTILEIIIDKFIPYKVQHFYLSVFYKSAIIKSYFEELQPKYKISYIEESQPLGTAGALYQLRNKSYLPLLVTNCDIIIDADYTDILNHHLNEKNDMTMIVSVKHYNIPYGVCEIENGGQLKKIIEKPEYDFLVNTGMYIISQKSLELIPVNEFLHITHLMEKVKEMGGKVGVYPISENAWVDTGEWEEYKKTMSKLQL